MKVIINNNTLTTETNRIDGFIKDLASETIKLKTLVGEIGNIWKGTDYNQFSEKLLTFCDNLQSLEKSASSYNNYVKTYNNAEIKLDEMYKDKKITLK